MICISPALEDYAIEVVKEMKSNGIRAEVMSGMNASIMVCCRIIAFHRDSSKNLHMSSRNVHTRPNKMLSLLCGSA